MAREKNTVDYFPFFVKDGKTLYVLQKKFGLEGIGFFTQLFRYLSQIPEHWTCIQDEFDFSRIVDFIGIDEKKCLEMLNVMAGTEKIDSKLWKEKGVIVSKDFLDSLERVYSKRQNSISIEIIRKKCEKIPALSGTFRHFPAIKERKGKERKGKNKCDNLEEKSEKKGETNPDKCDSKESLQQKTDLQIPEKDSYKFLYNKVLTYFKKKSPDHFISKEDYGREGTAIQRLVRDAMARDPTIDGQVYFLGNFLRTFDYICKGKIKSFLNRDRPPPFIPSILMSKGIKPRIIELMKNKLQQDKIEKELGERKFYI